MRTSTATVLHVFDTPPVVVALCWSAFAEAQCAEVKKRKTYSTIVRRAPSVGKDLEPRG